MTGDWPKSPTDAKQGTVAWYDIVATENWNDEEIPDYITVWTSGWLLEDTPQCLRIASSYNWEDEKWSDIHTFPKGLPEFVQSPLSKTRNRGEPIE